MQMKEWFGDVRIYTTAGWKTLTPHNVEVNLPITDEVFSADIRWVESDVADNTIVPDTLYCGNTIEIWASTTSTDNGHGVLLFRGRIYDIGEEYTGMFKEKAERFITAYGWGRDAMNVYRPGKLHAGYILDLFSTIGQELIELGIIQNTVFSYNHNVFVKSRDRDSTYWELMRGLCEDGDWDFYIDNGKTLHAFSRGRTTLSGTIVPDFRAVWKWDTENIINTIEVWGSSSGSIGGDTVWCDSTHNWSGNTMLNTIDTIDFVNWEGTASIVAVNDDTLVWLERTLGYDKTITKAIDMSQGGRIHFYCKFHSIWKFAQDYYGWSPLPTGVVLPFRMVITAYTDDDNYYVTTLSFTGGKYFFRAGFLHNWTDLYIGYNDYDPEGWSWYGNPKWNSIYKIRFQPISPMGTNNVLHIDDFMITDLSVVGSYADTESVNKYGLRTRLPLKDSDIPNVECANVLARHIVEAYGRPRITAENIEVDPDTLWNCPLGYRATMYVGGKNIPAEIRNITYSFDGKEITGKVDMANIYVPKVERVFSIMSNLMEKLDWNVQLFEKICQTEGVLDANSDLLVWERVSDDFGLKLEMSMQKAQLFTANSNWIFEGGLSAGSVGLNYGSFMAYINIYGQQLQFANRVSANNFSIQNDCYFKTKAVIKTNSPSPNYFVPNSADEVPGMLGFGVGRCGYYYGVVFVASQVGFVMNTVSVGSGLAVWGYYNIDGTFSSSIILRTIPWGSTFNYEVHISTFNTYNNILFVVSDNSSTIIKEITGLSPFNADTMLPSWNAWCDIENAGQGGTTVSVVFFGGAIASPWV